MERERSKEQGTDSFFGRLVYDRIVPQAHFFGKLNEIIPWERFTRKLLKYYRGKARIGRPPFDPALLLKMLLVAYLYDLSERQVEEMARSNIRVKYFLALAADELPPDHSTLTTFQRRLLGNGELNAFEDLPVEIVAAHQAYDDTRNHNMFKVRGAQSAIRFNDYRTQKKDKNKAGWMAIKEKPEYIRGQEERYKIVRESGQAKQGHGLGRCRHVGFLRYTIQVFIPLWR